MGVARFAFLALAAAPALATTYLDVCKSIAGKISSNSEITYALDPNFSSDIHHWYTTSTQIPTCVLNVGSANDVAAALNIISANRTPFAVKGGGHTSNPGFSSTQGVHMVLNNMKQVFLSPDRSTVELGFGLTWSEVYQELEQYGVMTTGGRVAGPGVAGFALGGGYSWKTNQHGLTSDTVKSYNVILSNGTITRANAQENPDLYFALRGGLNRFGVVTSAEFYTHPQPPQVYAGIKLYGGSVIDQVLNATAAFFKDNKDPKAQIITTIEGGTLGPTLIVLFFYDGATKPASFAPFDNIPTTIDLVKTQTFAAFVSGVNSGLITNARGTFSTLSTSKLTPTFLNAIKNESDFWSKKSLLNGGTSLSYDIEPFLTDWSQHAADGAYPHTGSPLPLNLYWAWTGAQNDAFWYDAMHKSIAQLRRVALAEGILPAEYTLYPNYAISGSTATELYGAKNAAKLKQIKMKYDPNNVMGLAGGFDILS